MTWQGLSHHVHRLHQRARSLPSHDSDERMAAAELVAREYGMALVAQLPALVNMGAIALSMDRLVVHDLRAPVPATVAATDLHSLPEEPPRLLRQACVVEVRRPGAEVLFGDTCSLGCYELDGCRYLVGLRHPDGVVVARWAPVWGGGDIEDGVAPERDARLLEGLDADEHAEWGRDAARFVVVLGLLLEADGAPVEAVDEGPRPAGRRKGKRQTARPWAVRRVYLSEQARRTAEPVDGDGAPREGLDRVEVQVTGHLKRQRHGPGGALRKWIYVAGYGARRWVAAKPLRIIVGTRRTT